MTTTLKSATYDGSCHCGALGWTFETAISPVAWTVRSCQCGFCKRHGARCTSDPKGAVTFRFDEPEQLFRYRFGLQTADFLLCRRCGIYLGAVIETPDGAFATLNATMNHGFC